MRPEGGGILRAPLDFSWKQGSMNLFLPFLKEKKKAVCTATRSIMKEGFATAVMLQFYFSEEECSISQDFSKSHMKRLDRKTILFHYRQHGARGTFMAFTCQKTLETGQVAKVLVLNAKRLAIPAIAAHSYLHYAAISV